MRYLASWRHLYRRRSLDEAEYDRPATWRDIANVSDQSLRRAVVLIGLVLLVSGALYWNQSRQSNANDQSLAKVQYQNALAQRHASISGCKRQNQLRSVNRDNLKAQHVADRANRKLFQPEQFGLTQHQYNVLIKQADARYRRALHRLHPVSCTAKYPPPTPAAISGD